MWWRIRRELLLYWIITTVPSSLLQPPLPPLPPLPLSLPVQMSALPPWKLLPLFQVEPGALFSNSSPFSSTRSVFLLPPPAHAHTPGLQASFGPYSVTQLVSETLRHGFPSLDSSLLSGGVERDEGGQERFRVRVLFQERGDVGTQGTCIVLHAFRETEQRTATCVIQVRTGEDRCPPPTSLSSLLHVFQPPLGLCVVTLTMPTHWFKEQNQSQEDMERWQRDVPHHRRHRHHRHGNSIKHQDVASLRSQPDAEEEAHTDAPRGTRHPRGPRHTWGSRHPRGPRHPQGPGHPRGPVQNQVQLYYSSFGVLGDAAERCADGTTQSQKQMFYIGAAAPKEQNRGGDLGAGEDRTQTGSCLNGQQEAELKVDSHVVICYHEGPVLIGQPIRASVSLRANFSADLVVIRMKVKKGLVSTVARRTFTSDLWTVTMERSQSLKHDVMSIFCHKQTTAMTRHSPSVPQQVVCLTIDGLRRSFGVAMTVSAMWWVEYSGHSKQQGAAVSVFSFADRHIFSIVPVTQSKTIVNTAILNNQPVSVPVTVLAISHGDKVSEVTSAVTCRSASEDAVKVSSDCSTLYVDGSESGVGSTCAIVEFLLGTLSGSVCLEVWAPSVPLQVLLGDPVLNAVEGWNLFGEEGCVPVYQRSSVQILTQFTAQDHLGRTTHLLGSSDWFVDVTELVRDWLRIEDPKVAWLSPQNVLIGLSPGETSLHVVSEQWDGVLGRCDVTVTADTVAPGDLSVQVVSGLGMSVTSSPAHSAIVTATVTAHNILYNLHQEASISVWLQFSDDTAALLSSFSDLPFSLRLSSLAETVVVVTSSPEQRIFAQGDGGGPLVQAELLVSSCDDRLISNSIRDDELPLSASSQRLARGSGWVRVNLDLGFVRSARKQNEEDEFGFDLSGMLFGSDMYVPNEDRNMSAGSRDNEKVKTEESERTWDEDTSRWTVGGKTLERAVLLPSMEEGMVYFSPSHEVEAERAGEQDGLGTPEFEVGLGAVLALFGLSTVLFLVNCLPCALRDRRKSRTKGMDSDPEAGDPEDRDPEDRDPKDRDPEDRDLGDRDPGDSNPEDRDPEDRDLEDRDLGDRDLEDRDPGDRDLEHTAKENVDNGTKDWERTIMKTEDDAEGDNEETVC